MDLHTIPKTTIMHHASCAGAASTKKVKGPEDHTSDCELADVRAENAALREEVEVADCWMEAWKKMQVKLICEVKTFSKAHAHAETTFQRQMAVIACNAVAQRNLEEEVHRYKVRGGVHELQGCKMRGMDKRLHGWARCTHLCSDGDWFCTASTALHLCSNGDWFCTASTALHFCSDGDWFCTASTVLHFCSDGDWFRTASTVLHFAAMETGPVLQALHCTALLW
jgi:hypothetical protein